MTGKDTRDIPHRWCRCLNLLSSLWGRFHLTFRVCAYVGICRYLIAHPAQTAWVPSRSSKLSDTNASLSCKMSLSTGNFNDFSLVNGLLSHLTDSRRDIDAIDCCRYVNGGHHEVAQRAHQQA